MLSRHRSGCRGVRREQTGGVGEPAAPWWGERGCRERVVHGTRAVIESRRRVCAAARARAPGGWLLRVVLALGGGSKREVS